MSTLPRSTRGTANRARLSSSLALVASVLLLLVTGPGPVRAATTESFFITGTSFMWSLVLSNSSVKMPIMQAVQTDIKAATATQYPGVTFNVTSATADPRAMSVVVDAGSSDITPAMHATIYDAALNTLKTYMDNVAKRLPAVAGYESVFPATYAFYNPLPLRPADSNDSSSSGPVLPIVATYTTHNIAFLTGDYATWQQIVADPAERSRVEDTMADIISTRLARSLITTTTTISNLQPMAEGDRKSISNGHSGVQVSFTVTQGMQELAKHPYSGDEISSIVFTIDVSVTYNGTIIVCRVAGDAGMKLTPAGKGMIAMAAVAAAIMIVAFVLTACLICCCGRWRGRRTSDDGSVTTNEPYVPPMCAASKKSDPNELVRTTDV